MSERWFDGIWLGLQFTSGGHIVAKSDGRVVRARAVHNRPETVKVTKDALNNFKVGPWNPSEVLTQVSEGKPSSMVEETQPPRAEEPVPRSFRITQEPRGKFDYTKGCPKFEALRRGDEHRTTHHSRECRQPFKIEMQKDDLLSKTFSEVEEKKKHYIARQVESSDRDRVGEVEWGCEVGPFYRSLGSPGVGSRGNISQSRKTSRTT